jgi:hypothetical protein
MFVGFPNHFTAEPAVPKQKNHRPAWMMVFFYLPGD